MLNNLGKSGTPFIEICLSPRKLPPWKNPLNFNPKHPTKKCPSEKIRILSINQYYIQAMGKFVTCSPSPGNSGGFSHL